VSIESNLYSFLSGKAAVTALVSTRIYPLKLPQGYSLPAISYQRVSSPRLYALSGTTGRLRARIQLDCWADTYSAVKGLADAVRGELNGHTGTFGSSTVDSLTLDAERDGFEEDTEVFRVLQEYIISHTEA
jgi:hypothetical protein